MIRRTAKTLLWTVLAVAAVLAALAGGLTWRLSQGPIGLDPLTPYVEQALSDPATGVAVTIDDMVLSWVDEDGEGYGRLDLRARQVRVTNADGARLAAVPELGISFSVLQALRGRLVPTRLELVHPQVVMIRHEDGHVGFNIAEAPAAPAAAPRGEGTGEGTGVGEGSTGVTLDMLDALRRPPDAERTLGLLKRLSVVGADLTVVNRQFGITWHATRADVTLNRDSAGIAGQGRLTLDLGGRPARVEAAGEYRTATEAARIGLKVGGLDLSTLAGVAPELAPLAGVDVPVDGTVEGRYGAGFRLERVRFDLTAAAGWLSLPAVRAAPYQLESAGVGGTLDIAGRKLVVDGLSARIADAGGARLSGSATLAEGADGLTGEAAVTLDTGGRAATLRLAATAGEGGRGHRVAADVANLEPALLAGLAPALEPLRAAALPLGGHVEAVLDAGFDPRAGHVDLKAGSGRLILPEFYAAPLAVAGATLHGGADRDAGRYTLDAFAIDLGGPRVEASGVAAAEGGRLKTTARIAARAVPVDDLARLWPLGVLHNTRDWITANLSKGVVKEATVALSGDAPLDDPAAFEPRRVDAALNGENMDVEYFRPLPPVTGITRFEMTSDGKSLTLHTHGGMVKDVQVGDGTVVIEDLGGHEHIDIQVPVQGPVRTILTVLDSPPLGYPSRLAIDPAGTEGKADARAHFRFPLLEDLKVDAIDIGVTAKLQGVGVKKVAAGLDASDANLDLALDTKGMTVKGTAKIQGHPSTIDWKEAFDSAAKLRTRVAVKSVADAGFFERFGLEAAPYATGPVGADVLFTIDQQKRFGLTGTLDLTRTVMAIDDLGWRKPAGVPGAGRFTVEFQKDKVARVSGITFDGGGLKAAATVDLVPATSALSKAQIRQLTYGATNLRAEVTVRDGGLWAVSVSGDSFDAKRATDSPDKSDRPDTPPATPDKKRRPMEVTAKLNRVVFGEGRRITDVQARAHTDGDAWTFLDLKANTAPKGRLALRFEPDGQRYRVRIDADDAGAMLHSLDLNDRVRGGKLRITGTTLAPSAGAPLEGEVDMTDYTVVDAPALARLLNAISPSGLAELLEGGPGIGFGRLTGNFRKEGRLLTLKNVRTSGSALGLTLEGQVDLVTDTANLRGTIVPVYGLNRIIGQIPLLGDLLSGGAGQGIFAATWTLRGPFADPDISVNPLAVLAPGFLRNLFFLGGDGSSTPAAPQKSDDQTR